MQTFLPYESYAMSAHVLDNRRLNKQITEALQIYHAIYDENNHWHNHPAVQMWKYSPFSVLSYGYVCYVEWRWRLVSGGRGGKISHKSGQKIRLEACKYVGHISSPAWIGDWLFHSRHRSILLAKDFEWYRQFEWEEEPSEQIDGRWPYVWPIVAEDGSYYLHEKYGQIDMKITRMKEK